MRPNDVTTSPASPNPLDTLSPMRHSKTLILVSILAGARWLSAADIPTDWIDPDTGHRVVRLSRDDNTQSLYFHQNAYTKDGRKIIVTTADGGIATINLATRETKLLVPGRVNVLVTGHQTGDVYFTKPAPGDATAAPSADGGMRNPNGLIVYAANADTSAVREVVKLPAGRGVSSLNADETLLLGSYVDGAPPPTPATNRLPGTDARFGQPNYEAVGADGKPMTYADAKDLRLHNTLIATRAGPPRVLFTISTKTGEIKKVLSEHEWLGHMQFSPTDPTLIMFCHEGTWHEVDRIWTVHTDGTGVTLMHKRTMNMEIAGHEFFAADGKMIWYDLQTPRGQDFWLGGYALATGKRTWYHLERNEWSVHFNVSPDGSLFAGDGGDSEMVARAPDGKWINLFRPERVPDVAGIKNPGSDSLIDIGVFHAERLVNMSKHDYRLEPNVTFSPDMKWIIFRSNMHGPIHVYAVEIAKH